MQSPYGVSARRPLTPLGRSSGPYDVTTQFLSRNVKTTKFNQITSGFDVA